VAAAHLVSIVVPVYNEARTVTAVLDRLLSVSLPAPREVVVVDDGSTDGTRETLDAYPVRDDVRVIHAPANGGKGAAVRLGLQHARGTILAIQDADLELDPAQLGELLTPIVEGRARVVYGSRFLGRRPDAPFMTLLGNRVLTLATNAIYGARLTDMETCYKLMETSVARSLELQANRFDIEPEITAKLLRAGHTILELPIHFEPRSRAQGKKIRWTDGVTALRVLWRHRP
jgi:dolichol-phosphate mannosyltransferase